MRELCINLKIMSCKYSLHDLCRELKLVDLSKARESDLKLIIYKLKQCDLEKETMEEKDMVVSWKEHFQKLTTEGKDISEANLSSISTVVANLRVLGETKVTVNRKRCDSTETEIGNADVEEEESQDASWNYLLLYITPGVLSMIHEIILNMIVPFFVSNSSSGRAVLTKRFAHHQIIGVFKKCLTACLTFLKRIKEANAHGCFDLEISKIRSIMCYLLDKQSNRQDLGSSNDLIEIGIDIRSNIGLIVSHSVLYFERYKMLGYFEKFDNNFLYEECYTIQFQEEPIKFKATEENVIALAFGVVNTVGIHYYSQFNETSAKFHTLLFKIAYKLVNLNYGARESTTLGVARVLEQLFERLSHPSVLTSLLDQMSPLYSGVQFFIFSNLASHIDAVKACSRNILSYLTRCLDRVEKSPGPGIRDLVVEVLSKPEHIRWISLACITRASKKSLVILNVKGASDLSQQLLSVPRIHKHAATDIYIDLMEYHFASQDFEDWCQKWLSLLFYHRMDLDDDKNLIQKRTIINSIMKQINSRNSPVVESMVAYAHKIVGDGIDIESPDKLLLPAEAIKIACEEELIGFDEESGAIITKEELEHHRVKISKSIHGWACNRNEQVRLAAFSFLIETRKTSEIFDSEAFEALKCLFVNNIVSQNAAFRQQMLSYCKRLYRRLKDGLSYLKREKEEGKVNEYEAFLKWLWEFLTMDGNISKLMKSNFARRIQTYDCLSEFVKVFDDLSALQLEDATNGRYLALLWDSYEDNKQHAIEILDKIPIPELKDREKTAALFNLGISMCKSVKPSDSVVGRYLMLLVVKKNSRKNFNRFEEFSSSSALSKLADTLESIRMDIKNSSLLEVSGASPMYGLVRGIRMIVESDSTYLVEDNCQELMERLLNLCFEFNEITFPVLGSPSPEGFLPGLPDACPDNKQVVRSLAAQMLLVCSWRTMKETCLLLVELSVNSPIEGEGSKKMSKFEMKYENVVKVGDHLLYLLKNLMHRGVFEQISVGFKSLVNRLYRSSSAELRALPEKWLRDASDEQHIVTKSTTRRSAGLPFAFQALLSVECHNENFLRKWLQQFLVFDDNAEKYQLRIHAMNVLRGLFRDASFSKSIMTFVPSAIKLAFAQLKSSNWNERNSGLMLYGAVLRRTFGSKLNLMSAPTFFRKFPSLFDFLLDQLKSLKREEDGDSQRSYDFTFHLLLLLSSLTPTKRIEDKHFMLSDFIPYIRQCGSSSDAEVRILAAKALMAFLISDAKKMEFLTDSISELASCKTKNAAHGIMLQIQSVLSSFDPGAEGYNVEEVYKEFSTSLNLNFSFYGSVPVIYQVISQLFMEFSRLSLNEEFLSRVAFDFRSLKQSFDAKFPPESSAYLPGFVLSEFYLSKCYVHFDFALNEDMLREEKLDSYLNKNNSLNSLSAFLSYLLEEQNGFLKKGAQDCIFVSKVINLYRDIVKDIKYPGQTDLEENILAVLSYLSYSPITLESKVKEVLMNFPENLLYRMVSISDGPNSTTECMKNAFIVLDVLFGHRRILSDSKISRWYYQKYFEWTQSEVQDDLRLTMAMCFPNLEELTSMECDAEKDFFFWHGALCLAQDDSPVVRKTLFGVLFNSQQFQSDLMCLRKVVKGFFEKFLKPEVSTELRRMALTVYISLILREDIQIQAETPDDVVPDEDNEEKIFDKSETNNFREQFTLVDLLAEAVKEGRMKMDEMLILGELNDQEKCFIGKLMNIEDFNQYKNLKELIEGKNHEAAKGEDCSNDGRGCTWLRNYVRLDRNSQLERTRNDLKILLIPQYAQMEKLSATA